MHCEVSTRFHRRCCISLAQYANIAKTARLPGPFQPVGTRSSGDQARISGIIRSRLPSSTSSRRNCHGFAVSNLSTARGEKESWTGMMNTRHLFISSTAAESKSSGPYQCTCLQSIRCGVSEHSIDWSVSRPEPIALVIAGLRRRPREQLDGRGSAGGQCVRSMPIRSGGKRRKIAGSNL